MGYNLPINGIYWGYNPFTNHLLTSWDIQVGWQIPPDIVLLNPSPLLGKVGLSPDAAAMERQGVTISGREKKADLWKPYICSQWKTGPTQLLYKVCWGWKVIPSHMGITISHYNWVVATQIFVIFIPKIGEDEPILTSIFFRWVGSTTNQIRMPCKQPVFHGR